MISPFKGRHFLSLSSFMKEEVILLLELASYLKKNKKNGHEKPLLKGKNIVLIFEKTSTRTRCAFEVASYDQGLSVTYLDSNGSQIGHKESIKDTARVLSRIYDAIEFRGYSHQVIESLAEYSQVPVFNGLTNEFHPTQILADVLTMLEHTDKAVEDISYVYLGDARNNMGNSLLHTGALLGMDVRIAAPRHLWPREDWVIYCKKLAQESGARIILTENVEEAVHQVDYVHTDVWVSMGESETVWAERVKLLKPYRIDEKLMTVTQNPDVKFMHCLPAYHNRETKIGQWVYDTFGLDGVEVTEGVFESEASVVFDQAENRLHTIKAILVGFLCQHLPL